MKLDTDSKIIKINWFAENHMATKQVIKICNYYETIEFEILQSINALKFIWTLNKNQN